MTFQISDGIQAPERIVKAPKEKRLTREIKNLQPGQSVAPLDYKTKQALVAFARYNGWSLLTQKIEDTETWRAWRLADKKKEVEGGVAA